MGSESESGKDTVFFNKPYWEKTQRAVERLQRARGMGHEGITRVGIVRAGSIARPVNFVR